MCGVSQASSLPRAKNGGLDLAVMAVLYAELAWCAESDPHASEVLTARFPHAVNFGNLTRADWVSVPFVDLVTARVPVPGHHQAGR